MKKLFTLVFLIFAWQISFAQTTVTLYATGAALSYTTGYSGGSGTTRVDNTIHSGNNNAQKGYAVFDLSTIPVGATITSVVVGFNTATLPAGTTIACNTYGYVGNLATVTTPLTLWTDMTLGTLLNTTSYGTTVGNHTLPTNAITQTFIGSNLGVGSKISICFTSTGTHVYNITGETGLAATAGAHAPYLQITYCSGITGLAATVSPNPVCAGSNLHVTGAGTGGTGFTWTGPAGTFTSTNKIDSVVGITTAGAGVYTFVTVDATGCNNTVTTAPVTVNPLPSAISGVVPAICALTTDSVWDVTGGGVWSASPATVATVSPTGVVRGVAGGTADITYTLSSTGCKITAPITINPNPPAITGPTFACMGTNTTLHDTIIGGTGNWSSAIGTASIATINPLGVVTPISVGTAIISYTNAATGCYTVETFTVGTMPSIITGLSHICVAQIDSLTNTVAGGTWTSTNPVVGPVTSSTGWLTGYAPGSVTITYTMPSGCFRTFPVTITSFPGPILNVHGLCPGDTVIVRDTVPYGTWSNTAATVASLTQLDSVSARIIALTAGTTHIHYNSCGTDINDSLVVNPIPKPIMGKDSVCVGDTVILRDSTNMGIWVSSDTSICTAAAAFGIITGIHWGHDSIIYKLPTGCYTKKGFWVDSLPATITGRKTLCPYMTDTLYDATNNGTWSSLHRNIDTSVTLAATINYGVFRGIAPGIDTVIYTKNGTAGCKIHTPITVNPLPAPIVGDTLVCSLDSTIMTDVTPGGIWTTSNIAVITADSFSGKIHTVDTNAGYAYVIYTLPSGCSVKQGFKKYPSPHPIIAYDGVIGEDTVVNNIFPYYQWFDSSTVGLIVGANSDRLAILYNEVYYVQVRDSLGCYGRSVSYYSNAAGVKNVNGNDNISIYPNPATGSKIYIIAPMNVYTTISTIEGKTVLEKKNAIDIDISMLPSGLYVVSLTDENGMKLKSQQLIKE